MFKLLGHLTEEDSHVLVSHILLYLFLIHLFPTIISPHHHSYHPSPHHSSLTTSKLTFSQILPSIDIWHIFGLISWIAGLLYGFFFVSVFTRDSCTGR